MAIQYSGGTNISTTFTCTTGTRQEIVTGLEDALNAAGWTTISGHHTSNVLLESATTPSPQSLVCRVQLQDPGSGTSAQVRFRNQGNTKAQTNQYFLHPAAGKVYRVIACPYQFFCFASDSTTVGRTAVAGGVPYLPSFLQGVVTECIWSQGNCTNSDTSNTLYNTFRNVSWTGFDNAMCNQWHVVNGNQNEVYGVFGGGNRPGLQTLIMQQGAQNNTYQGYGPSYRWHDGSLLTYEPLITWGLTSHSDEPLIRGQLWDAAMISGQFVADQTTTFDSHNWWVYTHNVAWGFSSYYGATLVLVTP
jgi:hypothetical protein